MADGKKIMVTDSHIHADTGHVNITVQTVTTEGNKSWNGPKRTYGMDALMFRSRFGSDIENVKKWIKQQHLAYDGAHQDLMDAVGKLKGTEI
jgi:hypothetical protein